MRKTKFANDEYYHVYNRGVDKRDVFLDRNDYSKFHLSMMLVNDVQDGLLDRWRNLSRSDKTASLADFRRLNLRKPLVEIVAYCYNPNHYHMIVRQVEEKGVEKFMQRLGTAYTMYFNKKNKRSGSLFQGRFKSIHIDSNEYLLYLSAYVNKNYFIHDYDAHKAEWPYSSLVEYRGIIKKEMKICQPEAVIGQFKDIEDYLKYIEQNALYLKNKKEEAKYLIEEYD